MPNIQPDPKQNPLQLHDPIRDTGTRVLEYSEEIIARAQHVQINSQRVSEVAEKLLNLTVEIPDWNFGHLATTDFEEAARYFLVFNAQNFCYWHGPEEAAQFGLRDGQRFTETGGEKPLGGAYLASKCIAEHWDRLKNPMYLATVTAEELRSDIFANEIPIPMAEERAKAFNEVGRLLLDKGDRFLTEVFRLHDGDALEIAESLAFVMPGWEDAFLKRAQLFVAMLYGRMQHEESIPIEITTLDDLTVFPDYRLPQALRWMGIMEVSEELSEKITRGELIEKGSDEELEIRAATVVAAQQLLDAVNVLGHPQGRLNALHLDYVLWLAGRGKGPDGVTRGDCPPHHRTRTTDY